jgi:predicted Zn-dependent peptidase
MGRFKAYKNFKLPILSLLSCLLFLAPLIPQEKEQSKSFVLENGLKVFLYERHTLPLVNLSIAVNLGTKDESDETSGLVHLLEHCILFRGTEARSGAEVGQDIRRHGAYFNAHTGFDLSLFEISLPSEYTDFALKNQKEILFNLKLTQEELDEEKKVIIEELNQLQDEPLKYGTSLLYQSLFKDHPYQRMAEGKREVIEAASAEQVEKFYRKFFIPSNCALAAVGDFSLEEMEKKVRETFGELKGEKVSAPNYNKIISLKKRTEIEQEMDVNSAYLFIGFIGPDYNHPDLSSVDVLTEVLGRGVNPMLNMPLRGRTNLVNNFSMSYSAYKYGGAIIITIILDPKNINMAKRMLFGFLRETGRMQYTKKDYLGEEQFYALDHLQSAKNQIKFRFHQAFEKGLNLATSLAMDMLLNESQERGSYLESILKVSSTDLRKAASAYVSKDRLVLISILPRKKK